MKDNFYKTLLNKSPTGYAYHKIICDESGFPCDYMFVDANKTFERITGLKCSEIIGKKAMDVFPDLKRNSFDWIQYYGKVALNNEEYEFEQFSEPLNKWYRVYAYSPKKKYFVTNFIDITKEKRQINELNYFFNVNLDLLCIADTNGNFVKTNKEWQDLLGYSNEELEKRSFLEFVHPDDLEATLDAVSLLDNQTTIIDFVNRYLAKDGSYRYLEWRSIPRGKLLYSSTRDITDRKNLDDNLRAAAELLDKTRQNYEIFFNAVDNFFFVLDEQLYIIHVNSTVINRSGYALEDIIGKSILMLYPYERREEAVCMIKEMVAGVEQLCTIPIITKSGRQIPVETKIQHGVWNGNPVIFAVCADISKTVLSEEKFSKLFNLNPSACALSNVDTCEYIEVNDAFNKLFGFDENEAIGKTAVELDIISMDALEEFLVKSNKNGSVNYIETQLKSKNNDIKYVLMSSEDISIQDKKYRFTVINDITEIKQKQNEIEYLSFHDQLTGLYNRRFYEEEQKRLNTKRNLPITILMGDVNSLKLVNDSFGHAAGDELLKKAAEVIKKGCRSDEIISRIGGDEFLILLPKTDFLETEKIIKRINGMLSHEKIVSLNVSISFGYSTKYLEEESIEEVFKRAEDNMYSTKLLENTKVKRHSIDSIIKTLYKRSKGEERHAFRVSNLCQRMGEALGFSEFKINELKQAGLLHDIGKIAIDEKILNKKEKLSDNEWNEIKRHSEVGYRIVSTVNEMSILAEYLLSQHERWDGKGYPRGLKGREIPFESRIIAIADAYDAMLNNVSNHTALSSRDAVAELKKNVNLQFDSELVKLFIEKVINKDKYIDSI